MTVFTLRIYAFITSIIVSTSLSYTFIRLHELYDEIKCIKREEKSEGENMNKDINKEELDRFILYNFKDYLGLVAIGSKDTIKKIAKAYSKEDDLLTEVNGIALDYFHFTTDVSGHRVTFIAHSSIDEKKGNELLYVFPLKDRENAGIYYSIQ